MKELLSDGSNALTRRRFLQSSILATAGVLGLPQHSQAAESRTSSMGRSSNPFKGKRPNFLILMCDEMRFPPVYESQETKKFRQTYLKTPELPPSERGRLPAPLRRLGRLRARPGVDLHRTLSVAPWDDANHGGG